MKNSFNTENSVQLLRASAPDKIVADMATQHTYEAFAEKRLLRGNMNVEDFRALGKRFLHNYVMTCMRRAA